MTVKLTKHAKHAGCAAKYPIGSLFPLLSSLPKTIDPNVLVGNATSDDAAVYKINEEIALVLTTDFFTPIVDSPYDFGAIAAANALSDIYAMGGYPVAALNILGIPTAILEPPTIIEILKGGAEKAQEAGIDIVGGHTINTAEPIYGLAVTGIVSPQNIISNQNAKPGDFLVLSKPIGLGIITTAAKQDQDTEGAISQAIHLMTTLNQPACEAMCRTKVLAATDVTGFGLLGHLHNLARASQCQATIWMDKVPVIPSALEYVKEGIVPGGTHANWRFLNDWVKYASNIDKESQLLLCDAQTSGGLLMAVNPDKLDDLLEKMNEYKTPCATVIGIIQQGKAGHIEVIKSRE